MFSAFDPSAFLKLGAFGNGRAAEALLFWDSTFGDPPQEQVRHLLKKTGDVFHAGLCLGTSGHPSLIDFVHPAWAFNRDAAPDIESTSWRVSFRACLVRADTVRKLGFIRPGFETLDAAALEWGHRILTRGAIVRHCPGLLAGSLARPKMNIKLPLTDQLRFIGCRFGRKWTVYATLRSVMTGMTDAREALRAWNRLGRVRKPAEPPPLHPSTIVSPAPALVNLHSGPPAKDLYCETPFDSRVTVLIPTIDRYPYLRTLLEQLRWQTVRPSEIIVVDQTHQDRRQTELSQSFADLPLKWIWRKNPGQCSSRNAGLLASKGDYILLLDDDVEISPNLIEAHLENLHRFGAAASCGVAEEIGASPLNPENNFTRVSDVFPAGNTMVTRSALAKAGLFDLAYDKGSRADADLGMRLYLSGEIVILNGGIQVLHHHAPAGGLRRHKARTVTAASSRSRLLHRNLPGVTEMYLAERYFSARQVRESTVLRAITTFRSGGGVVRKTCKILASTVALPFTLVTLRRNRQAARTLLLKYPQIPPLQSTTDWLKHQLKELKLHSPPRALD